MAIDPEIIAAGSAIAGGGLVLAGKYVYTKILFAETGAHKANGNGNGNGNGRLQMLQKQCPEHPQVVQSIKDLSTKFDQNNIEIQRKLNKTANDVAWIRGYLDKEEKSND